MLTLSSSLALGWLCFFFAAVGFAGRLLEVAALALAAPPVLFKGPFLALVADGPGGSGAGRFAGAVVGVRAGEGVGRSDCEAEVG